MPGEILELHNDLSHSRETLSITDYGAGSRVSSDRRRKVSSITRSSSVNKKFGNLLYRLSRWYQPAAILELGTGIGISTAYLGAGNPGCDVYTVEGSLEKHTFAREQLTSTGLKNISFYRGKFESHFHDLLKKLKSHSIVFIDGDHRYDPTVNTVRSILEEDRLDDLIIILDDIHWSDEMERAWNEVCKDERVAISINLFFMGILIRKVGLNKQHFNITL